MVVPMSVSTVTLTSPRFGSDLESALRAFPQAEIGYQIDAKRQGIVDSWPEDVDDAAARRDWGFAPSYDFDRALHEYLIPTIREAHR